MLIKKGVACFSWEANGKEHGIYLSPVEADFLSRLHGVAPQSMHSGDFLYFDEAEEKQRGFMCSFVTLAGERIVITAGMEGRDFVTELWRRDHAED